MGKQLKPYTITGRVMIYIDIEVDARSEEEALALAKEQLCESYNLDISGYHHNPNTDLEYELDVYSDDIAEDEDI